MKWSDEVGAWGMLYLGYQTDYFTDPAIGLSFSTDVEGTDFPRAAAPIYTPTRPGGWDADFLTSPSVVIGSDGVLRVYFIGASYAVDGGSMKVGVLTSDDGGFSWSAGPPGGSNPIFEGVPGAWDESILDCYVHFVGGRYLMWYTSFEEPFSFDSEFKIGLAESEEGYQWTRHPANPIIIPGAPATWNDAKVLDGEVIIEADGSLLMVAYGASTTPPDMAFPDFKPNRVGSWRSYAQ